METTAFDVHFDAGDFVFIPENGKSRQKVAAAAGGACSVTRIDVISVRDCCVADLSAGESNSPLSP